MRTRARVANNDPRAWNDKVTIHCSNTQECIEVQDKLLSYGFRWNSGARVAKPTPSNIIIAYFHNWVTNEEEKIITHFNPQIDSAGVSAGYIDLNYHSIRPDELDLILSNRYDKKGRLKPPPPPTRAQKARALFFGLVD